jgi:hypothetical protein
MDDYDVDVASIKPPDEAALRVVGDAVNLEDVAPDLGGLGQVQEALEAVDQSSAGGEAVRIARGQLGVRESGGEDCGVPHDRYVRYFGSGLPPLPWCAFFVSWSFAQAGYRPPWRNPGYVGSVLEWARANGKIVEQPAHGDIFGIGDSHMGLVAGANPGAGQIFTVEGNWSDQVLSRLVNYRGAGIWFARF